MDIDQKTVGDVLVVRPKGSLDTRTAPELERTVGPLLASNPYFVVDLEDVEYVSSAGLRVFLMMAKRLTAAGGALVICSLNKTVQEILEVSGFLRLFNIAPSAAEGLKLVKNTPVTGKKKAAKPKPEPPPKKAEEPKAAPVPPPPPQGTRDVGKATEPAPPPPPPKVEDPRVDLAIKILASGTGTSSPVHSSGEDGRLAAAIAAMAGDVVSPSGQGAGKGGNVWDQLESWVKEKD